VNVSSGLGSLKLNSDPSWQFASVKMLGYCASKAALNMLTVQLAYELRDTEIKVNSADPGFTATDLNDHRGHQTVEEGAAETVRWRCCRRMVLRAGSLRRRAPIPGEITP
jgi:NAD(P)-dependent dehydrogenase (short-subunit alcohol dehydrogenase family)